MNFQLGEMEYSDQVATSSHFDGPYSNIDNAVGSRKRERNRELREGPKEKTQNHRIKHQNSTRAGTSPTGLENQRRKKRQASNLQTDF